MTVESTTTIAGLNPASPAGTDQIKEGDDHIRLLKTVLQNDAAGRALTPQDHGAKGDGATDDTAAVQAAVSAALATGREIYWPTGTYLTTASIANLHKVRHHGPGAIKRGSATFYPCPTSVQSNRLYMSPTGACTTVLTAGASVSIDLGAASLTLAFFGAPAINTVFEATALLRGNGKDNQRTFGKLLVSAGSPRMHMVAMTQDSDADLPVTVAFTLANAADSITIYDIEVWKIG